MAGIRVTFHTEKQQEPGSNPSGQPLPKFTAQLDIDFSMYRAMLDDVATHVDPSDLPGQNSVTVFRHLLSDTIVRNMLNEKFQAFITQLKASNAINSVNVELFV